MRMIALSPLFEHTRSKHHKFRSQNAVSGTRRCNRRCSNIPPVGLISAVSPARSARGVPTWHWRFTRRPKPWTGLGAVLKERNTPSHSRQCNIGAPSSRNISVKDQHERSHPLPTYVRCRAQATSARHTCAARPCAQQSAW